MATRTMIFFLLLFIYIRVKTMANFRKGPWELRVNIRCIVVVKLLPTLKHVIN